MLLLIPPLLFMPGNHAVAVTTSIQGVMVGISRVTFLDRRDFYVYSLSAILSLHHWACVLWCCWVSSLKCFVTADVTQDCSFGVVLMSPLLKDRVKVWSVLV